MTSRVRLRSIEAMGLGPVWVRRDFGSDGAGVAGARPAFDGEAPSERAERIGRMDWATLQETVASCTACRLCETRRQTVFGVGVERPDWLIVGEGPGADEDAEGEPFVGKAGKLLDAMLASIGVSRERNGFILNVVKCRPPGNRDPSADEMAACRPFLDRQIALLAPRLILVVGRVASLALLKTEASMASLRGREHRFDAADRPIPVVATFHPAYLLRSPEEKAKAWTDLCAARSLHERLASAIE